jgi:hypothetical protein
MIPDLRTVSQPYSKHTLLIQRVIIVAWQTDHHGKPGLAVMISV